MSWIDDVRKKSDDEKRKLIRNILIAAFFALIAAWVLIGTYNPSANENNFLHTTTGILEKTKDIKFKP